LTTALRDTTPSSTTWGARFWRTRLTAVRRVVERGIARGELPAGTDPDELIMQIVGPIWFAVSASAGPSTTASCTGPSTWCWRATRR
jgi:hypothetical protein